MVGLRRCSGKVSPLLTLSADVTSPSLISQNNETAQNLGGKIHKVIHMYFTRPIIYFLGKMAKYLYSALLTVLGQRIVRRVSVDL